MLGGTALTRSLYVSFLTRFKLGDKRRVIIERVTNYWNSDCISRICSMSRSSRLRSATSSSSACLPSTERSVVYASCRVASRKRTTWMFSLLGIDDAEVHDRIAGARRAAAARQYERQRV